MKKLTAFSKWSKTVWTYLVQYAMPQNRVGVKVGSLSFLGTLLMTLLLSTAGIAQNITLTTAPLAATNIMQGTNNNIVYIVRMDVAVLPVTINSMQFTLTGTHDNNDLPIINLYFNATAPSLTGASLIEVNGDGLFAAPHDYNLPFNMIGTKTMAAGSSGYFIVTVNTDPTANNGHTIKVDGLAHPASFGYTTVPTITNNQTDVAGEQTILSSTVTLSSSPVPAGIIAQGINNNVVYIVKMDVASMPVTINSMQFTLTGTHDNNDLPIINLYFNATAPSLTGASLIEVNGDGLFAAPHDYNLPFNMIGTKTMAAGSSGYFIITVNIDPAANNGHTIKVDGLAHPASFGYTTAPTITNNQTDVAGVQTIQGAGVTLSSSPVPAGIIAQGINNNVVYIVKMDVASQPVTINSMQFTLTGTHDNNDLPIINLYFNATAPSLTGATNIEINGAGLFAAPHDYNLPFNMIGTKTMAAGSSGYFIITVNIDPAANNGHTIKVDGLAHPASFGYTTAPTITNNQTDVAGVQTIQGAGVTLSSSPVPAGIIAQGINNNVVYIVKMDVASQPVTINSMQFTLTGTHDNNDLPIINLYFNATAPSLTGATNIEINGAGLFAAPHDYNLPFNMIGTKTMAAGSSGYFIVTVNTDLMATSGNTIKVDGLAHPASFGYTTAPTIINNQADVAGEQTIQAAGVTLTSSPIAPGIFAQGSNNNIVYIVKMDVASQPVIVSNMQFTLNGTHDNNDLTIVNIFFNDAAPSLTGASQISINGSALFAAPHDYNLSFNVIVSKLMAAGSSGYFIVTVNTDPAATGGNTVKVDGLAHPASFGYSTAPTITNNQADLAGNQSIGFILPLNLLSFNAMEQQNGAVQLQWVTANEINAKHFEVAWSNDGVNFAKIAQLSAAGNSQQNKRYSYLHTKPVDGNNYYRLTMMDIDGHFTYSPVIKINRAVTITQVVVFPNPVLDQLQLQVQAVKAKDILLKLYSTDGKLQTSKLFSVKQGNNQLSWNLAQLAAGNYFISADNNDFETIRIIKN